MNEIPLSEKDAVIELSSEQLADDDRAMDMLRKTLGWAREDELGARVISAPDPELIKWFQGGRKVRP